MYEGTVRMGMSNAKAARGSPGQAVVRVTGGELAGITILWTSNGDVEMPNGTTAARSRLGAVLEHRQCTDSSR